MKARVILEVWNQSSESWSGQVDNENENQKSIFEHVEYIHRQESYILK